MTEICQGNRGFVYNSFTCGEALTDQQAAFAEVYRSESVSIMAELALGNEHFARRLLDADASIVEKLLNRIAEAKEALARRKDPEAKAAFAEIRKAEEMFLDALAEKGMRFDGGKIVGADEEEDNDSVKYALRYTTANKPVVVITENILDGVPEVDWIQTVKSTIASFSPGIPIHGRLIKVNLRTKDEFTRSKDSQKLEKHNKVVYEDKFKSAKNLDEIVLASTNYINEDLNHARKDNFVQFARGDVLIRVGRNDYTAKVIVGFTSGQQMVLYDIIDFQKTSFTLKSKKSAVSSPSNQGEKNTSENSSNTTDSVDSIHDFEPIVNPSDKISSENSSEPVKKSRKANSQTSGKTSAAPSEVSHLTAMQKQTVANYTRAKVYTKAEALAVVEDMARMLDESYGFDGGMGEASGFVTLTKAVKDDAARQLWAAYNTAKTDAERREIAGRPADNKKERPEGRAQLAKKSRIGLL